MAGECLVSSLWCCLWGGQVVGGIALLEKACHWRVGFVSKKPSPFPVLPLRPALFLWLKMQSCSILLRLPCLPACCLCPFRQNKLFYTLPWPWCFITGTGTKLRHFIGKGQSWGHALVTPALGKQRWADPWGSLAGQPGLAG